MLSLKEWVIDLNLLFNEDLKDTNLSQIYKHANIKKKQVYESI